MKIHDCLLLPILQPEIPRNPAIVLVHLAIALAPVVELTGRDAEPSNESPGADLSLVRPAPDEIHDLVPRVVRHPNPVQISPRLFLKRHAPPSTRPAPRPWSGSSWSDTRSVPVRVGGWLAPWSQTPQLRSRRTLSANGRRPSAGAPALSRASRSAPAPASADAQWRPSLRRCSVSVPFSCALSVILTAERSLHFHLRRNTGMGHVGPPFRVSSQIGAIFRSSGAAGASRRRYRSCRGCQIRTRTLDVHIRRLRKKLGKYSEH